MNNLKNEFLKHSQDFLVLLGDKARRAEKNQTAAQELGILEFYHDGVEAIINKYEENLHSVSLAEINRKAMYKLLESEYEKLLSELFKPSPEPLQQPSKVQFEKIKNKFKAGEVTVWQVCQHFRLNDEQVKLLLDGK